MKPPAKTRAPARARHAELLRQRREEEEARRRELEAFPHLGRERHLPFRVEVLANLPTTALDPARGELKVNLPAARVWFEADTRTVRYERQVDGAWSDCARDDIPGATWDTVVVYVVLGGHYEHRAAVAEGGCVIRVF